MNKIIKIVQNLTQKIPTGAVSFAFIGFAMILVPFSMQSVEDQSYKTRIKFNQQNIQLLTLEDKKVEVYSAGSRQDLNNLDSEAIKGMMQAIAPEYGVDWKLVYAIGYHESGNYGSSLARRQNNFFGRKANSSSYASWNTPEDGIRDEFSYLKEHYFDRGLTTPASINRVYAEDMSWHLAVQSVMDRL